MTDPRILIIDEYTIDLPGRLFSTQEYMSLSSLNNTTVRCIQNYKDKIHDVLDRWGILLSPWYYRRSSGFLWMQVWWYQSTVV